MWGTHTVKGGVYYEHVINNQPGNGDSNGLIELDTTWDGSSSGNTFADLLPGHGTYYQRDLEERRSTTWPTTSSRASCRTPGRSSPG